MNRVQRLKRPVGTATTAGVVPLGNWNHIPAASDDNPTSQPNSFALKNSAGGASGLTFSTLGIPRNGTGDFGLTCSNSAYGWSASWIAQDHRRYNATILELRVLHKDKRP
jgi:hypothetical protein